MNLPFVWIRVTWCVLYTLLQYYVPHVTCLQNIVLQANPRRVTVSIVVQERRVRSEAASQIECRTGKQVKVFEVQPVPEELSENQMLLPVH